MRWLVLVLLMISGCGQISSLVSLTPREPAGDQVLLREAYRAADTLHGQLRSTEAAAHPMLVAAFVDGADVEHVSDVGRLLAEQVASRLGQLRYAMKDVQLRSQSVVVRPGGVLALSRRLEDLDPEAEAYAVLVGTYTQIGARLFVNVRVVRAQDNVVLAAADMDLPAKALVPRQQLPYREPSVATSLSSRVP
ncbi:MAG: hypothetical protein JG774_1821 [Desulfomicrobiaceae bacterium]|nr:hypothetical protein [Desulfomicrobiaceae bacterium]